jgi:hypothetical protein
MVPLEQHFFPDIDAYNNFSAKNRASKNYQKTRCILQDRTTYFHETTNHRTSVHIGVRRRVHGDVILSIFLLFVTAPISALAVAALPAHSWKRTHSYRRLASTAPTATNTTTITAAITAIRGGGCAAQDAPQIHAAHRRGQGQLHLAVPHLLQPLQPQGLRERSALTATNQPTSQNRQHM